MPGVPVHARHWTCEARGVSELRGAARRSAPGTPTSSWWPTGCRSTWSGCPTARTHVEAQPRWPGHRARAAAAPPRGRVDRLARHSRRATRSRSSRTTCSCARCGCPPTTSPSTTRASPTPRCGRSTTTSSSSRSTTASGGTATSRSTGGSPRPPREPRRRARRCGSRTTSCSWCRRCCGCCGRISPSASSCTSRSRRSSCSCRCRGGPRSSRACSAPTWSASTCPAAHRTS